MGGAVFPSCYFSSVQCSVMSNSLRSHESQHARIPCPSPTPRVHPNSYPSSWWCNPAISSSVFPFSSCPESLSASGSFPVSQLFTWGGQSIGVSASASVLPMNIHLINHINKLNFKLICLNHNRSIVLPTSDNNFIENKNFWKNSENISQCSFLSYDLIITHTLNWKFDFH